MRVRTWGMLVRIQCALGVCALKQHVICMHTCACVDGVHVWVCVCVCEHMCVNLRQGLQGLEVPS